MLKKIEKNFTILSMTILSITVLICFVFIYGFMNNNINKEIERDLRKNLSMPFDRKPLGEIRINNSLENDNLEMPPFGFVVIYNLEKNTILDINGLLNIDNINDFQNIESIIKISLDNQKNTGKIKLDNSRWAFLKESIDNENIILSFVERSSQDEILNTLIKVFSIVYIILLLLIYIISKYFGKKSIEPAKLAYEKQTEFIEDVSHELKTPIAIIQTNAEVLKINEDEKISDEIEWIDNIISEVKRMDGLIKNLLGLTINISDKENYEEIELDTMINSVINSMQGIAKEKNQFITAELNKIKYNGNKQELERVIYLILDNAIKYGYENSLIDIKLLSKNNNIIISIENSGDNIDKDEIDKIFDRFYRGEKSRNSELGGHGLGLSMAEKIIKDHNGTIKVISIDNKTKFDIIIEKDK